MQLSPRYDGPPIIEIDGPPDDQRAPVIRQRRRLQATLAGLGVDEWSAPSRCDGWTVQDVVAHLVTVNNFWNASTVAGLRGTPTRVLAGFDPAATPTLLVGSMRALTPTEVLDQFVASNDAFLGTIADLDEPQWSNVAESPAGHVPVRLLAQHALWDCWIHERDIALPLGMIPDVEPDEVISSLRYAVALSPAFDISCGNACVGSFTVEATAPDANFALEVGAAAVVRDDTVASDAPCLRGDAVVLLEALSLRAPLPPSTPPEWRQLLTGLATAFDSEVPIS
jgi:uncharacterized protein (TIGR03083 family)